MKQGEAERPPFYRRWNWWKIGFFVALILFEFTRELFVLELNSPAEPSVMKTVFEYDGWVTARGKWTRTDGGSPIMPVAVTIECRREDGVCLEVTTNSHAQTFFAPEIDRFEAHYTASGVSYENDQPKCARYSVSIDTKQDRVIATRIRKPDPKGPCADLEERVAMELTDGYVGRPDGMEGHFVPAVWLLVQIVKTLGG